MKALKLGHTKPKEVDDSALDEYPSDNLIRISVVKFLFRDNSLCDFSDSIMTIKDVYSPCLCESAYELLTKIAKLNEYILLSSTSRRNYAFYKRILLSNKSRIDWVNQPHIGCDTKEFRDLIEYFNNYNIQSSFKERLEVANFIVSELKDDNFVKNHSDLYERYITQNIFDGDKLLNNVESRIVIDPERHVISLMEGLTARQFTDEVIRCNYLNQYNDFGNLDELTTEYFRHCTEILEWTSLLDPKKWNISTLSNLIVSEEELIGCVDLIKDNFIHLTKGKIEQDVERINSSIKYVENTLQNLEDRTKQVITGSIEVLLLPLLSSIDLLRWSTTHTGIDPTLMLEKYLCFTVDLSIHKYRDASVLATNLIKARLKSASRSNVKPNVNATQYDGTTVAMIAAENNKPVALKKLIELGADLSMKNNNGDTARDIAINNNNNEILVLLAELEKDYITKDLHHCNNDKSSVTLGL